MQDLIGKTVFVSLSKPELMSDGHICEGIFGKLEGICANFVKREFTLDKVYLAPYILVGDMHIMCDAISFIREETRINDTCPGILCV